MAGVKMTDNSQQVLEQMRQNVKAALTAMGVTGVELVNRQMLSGYGKPIRDTGDLMRDVSFEVEASGENTVDIGNSLFYGPYVHEGTSRMAGRPYITDALFNGEAGKEMEEVVSDALKQNFE